MSNRFDVIHVYTRREAIEDGVLVDVTETAKEAGFRYPVAFTRTVFEEFVRVPEGVEGQDEAGRRWDVLMMLRFAIKRGGAEARELQFQLYVRNDSRGPKLVTLKAVCGPDDDGAPCVTVLNLAED